MAKAILFILLLVTCFSSSTEAIHKFLLSPESLIHAAAESEKPAESKRSLYNTSFFPQVLDHFTFLPQSYNLFQQKYLIDYRFWGGASQKAPIFVYTGNEGNIEWFAENTGFLFDIAPKFRALLVFIEECTEIVMPTSCSKKSMFQPFDFNYTEIAADCKVRFGVEPRPHWITTEFGGYRIEQVLRRFGSNIIFSNGMLDPWSGGGMVLNPSSAVDRYPSTALVVPRDVRAHGEPVTTHSACVLKNISASIVAIVTEKVINHKGPNAYYVMVTDGRFAKDAERNNAVVIRVVNHENATVQLRVLCVDTAENLAPTCEVYYVSDHMKALPAEYLPDLLRPYFEFLLESIRNVIREEMTQILMDMGISKPDRSLCTHQIEASNERKLKLDFGTSLPERIFAGRKLKGRQEEAIEIRLLDAATGALISSGPESMLELDIVVLDGGFNDRAPEDFENHIVKERVGKGPLLKGDLKVALKNGIATLGGLSFTDNSRWTRNGKFKIGVTIPPGHSRYIHVQEAVSDAFCVKENRGEYYEKHDQPDSTDKVWRLKGIAKDGPHHKALTKENIFTVEDFRQKLVMDPARLRDIFGSKLSKRRWESMVEHAMRCTPSKKVYTYTYRDGGGPWTIVFNSIYEIRGLFANDRYIPADSFSENEQVYVNSVKPRAYRDCKSFQEFDEEEMFGVSDSIHRRRASEEADPMEPCDHVPLDMQDTEAHSGDHILPEHTGTTMASIPESLSLPQTVHGSLPENPPTTNSNSQAQLLADHDPSALNRSGSYSSFQRMPPRSPSGISISLEQCLLAHVGGQDTEAQSGVVPANYDRSTSISEDIHRSISPLWTQESLQETSPTPSSNSPGPLFVNERPFAVLGAIFI